MPDAGLDARYLLLEAFGESLASFLAIKDKTLPEDEEAFCAAILNELTRHHTEPERRDIIAHYASSNFAQAQFVAKLEQVYQRAVRDFSG